MSENYLDIPDIPEVPLAIKNAVSKEKLVLFIGAGVSRLLDCPSWETLASLVIDYIYRYDGQDGKNIDYRQKIDLESLNPRKALSICSNIISTKGLRSPDYKIFFEKKPLSDPNIYDNLCKFNGINITTNYDLYLAKAAERYLSSANDPKVARDPIEQETITPLNNNKPNIIFRNDDFSPAKLSRENIFYLHGIVNDTSSMIITISDYLDYHSTDSSRAYFLKKVFNEYTVLFIGYGLEEYEILEFLVSKYLKSDSGHLINGGMREIKHYMLYSVFKNEASLFYLNEAYYLSLGIQLEPYPLDVHGYNHLESVIKNWADEIGPEFKPAKFIDKVSVIEDII